MSFVKNFPQKLGEFVIDTANKKVDAGYKNEDAMMFALMWMLFLEGLAVTAIVFVGSLIFGLDTAVNVKICLILTSFFGLMLLGVKTLAKPKNKYPTK